VKYVYSVVRFVPDPIRGEFVNVGMIIGSDDTSEWELRVVGNTRRARALDDRRLLPAVWDFIDKLGRRLDDYSDAMQGSEQPEESVSEEWLSQLSESSQNVVQLSFPAPVRADNLEQAFKQLFPQFIAPPETRSDGHTNKHPALAAVRRVYHDIGLKKQINYEERAKVHGLHHEETFDFVVKNGRAVQLAETFSFQVPARTEIAETIKAWAWTVRDIRTHGGEASLRGGAIEVPKDVAIIVVYVPSPESPIMREALSAFDEIGANAVPVDRADEIARNLSATG
jgi:Protein of unknown function (DUF3037)